MSSRPISLLVRNLRYTTSPDKVRKFFSQFGEVKDVYLPLDYYTRLPRGFGFVEFTREEDAEVCLDSISRYAVLDGSEISVAIAQQGRKSPDSMRHREYQGGDGGRKRREGDDADGPQHHNSNSSRGASDRYSRRQRSHSRGAPQSRYRSRSRSDGHRYRSNQYSRRYREDDDDPYYRNGGGSRSDRYRYHESDRPHNSSDRQYPKGKPLDDAVVGLPSRPLSEGERASERGRYRRRSDRLNDDEDDARPRSRSPPSRKPSGGGSRPREGEKYAADSPGERARSRSLSQSPPMHDDLHPRVSRSQSPGHE